MNNEAPSVKLLAYWLLVGIPLVWGVTHTLIAASHLFGF